MQEPDPAEKLSSSPYRCHTDALWMKEGDSLTLSYIQYGVYVTNDLRKIILPIPLVDTQPHTIMEVGNFTDLFKQGGLWRSSLVLQTKAPLSPNSMQNLDWSLKMTFEHC